MKIEGGKKNLQSTQGTLSAPFLFFSISASLSISLGHAHPCFAHPTPMKLLWSRSPDSYFFAQSGNQSHSFFLLDWQLPPAILSHNSAHPTDHIFSFCVLHTPAPTKL